MTTHEREKCTDNSYSISMSSAQHKILCDSITLYEDTQKRKLKATYDALVYLLGDILQDGFEGDGICSNETKMLFSTMNNCIEGDGHFAEQRTTYNPEGNGTSATKMIVRAIHEDLLLYIKSLDYYSRLGGCQLNELKHVWGNWHKLPSEAQEVAESLIDEIKSKAWGFQGGGGLGLSESPETSRIAYEMVKVLQNIVAKEEGHSTISVWHDEPLKTTREPLIEVRKV